MAADVLPRVFDLFMQADRSLARGSGGLGIGLTVVRRLIELHGGRVEASSPGLGQGSEFALRLPTISDGVVHASQAPAPMEATSPNAVAPPVPVADDHEEAAPTPAMICNVAG